MTKEEKPMPSFYAIVPAEVRYSDIPDGAKLLYAEITSLCKASGKCWATNAYFSELYGRTDRTIRRWINILEENGFVKTFFEKEDGKTTRIISLPFVMEKVHVAECPPRTKMSGGADKNVRGGGTKMSAILLKEINKGINKESEPKKTHNSILEQLEADHSDLAETLREYIQYRKEIKAPMTVRALELMIGKLDKMASSDADKIAILNQSIVNGWKGVFPLKKNNTNKRTGNFESRDTSATYQALDSLSWLEGGQR